MKWTGSTQTGLIHLCDTLMYNNDRMIRKVALFGSGDGELINRRLKDLINALQKRKIDVAVLDKLTRNLDSKTMSGVSVYKEISINKDKPDMIFSIGGDGTFLETILYVRDSGIPVAGVNAGRLGFLANIHDDIEDAIELLINGKYSLIERFLLELIEPAGILGNSNVALNDITIQKADLNMITIKVYVDDRYLNTYWADGLIISTATGSTAYNLATGGPILSPQDESIIISPLSPHNLTVRPIVLPGNSSLRLIVEGRGSEYLTTCDFRTARLPYNKELLISQPGYRLKTVNVEGQDFFSTLRDKLMWGADPRN